MDLLKAMPSSKEAEQAVLGCLLDNGSMEELLEYQQVIKI
ncbi:hypothetical protein CSC2_38180 [Clostridium zeae]|uniref:Uncharacterized protein n=1 Tax=Clostridium zeae TaxID=2759022 RepID=A0ABQ1EEP3_9CLOT|nr:hypothetical protein CSC2_38180 [Clostridium zeae]